MPKRIRALKANISSECINPIHAYIKNGKLKIEFEEYANINWEKLDLTVKTRDTIYQIPISEFEISYTDPYGYIKNSYSLRLPSNKEAKFFLKKQVKPKRRTFWQRLGDIFR